MIKPFTTLTQRNTTQHNDQAPLAQVSRHNNLEEPLHSVHLDDVKILDRDNKWFIRGVHEALHIRTHRPPSTEAGGSVSVATYLGSTT